MSLLVLLETTSTRSFQTKHSILLISNRISCIFCLNKATFISNTLCLKDIRPLNKVNTEKTFSKKQFKTMVRHLFVLMILRSFFLSRSSLLFYKKPLFWTSASKRASNLTFELIFIIVYGSIFLKRLEPIAFNLLT